MANAKDKLLGSSGGGGGLDDTSGIGHDLEQSHQEADTGEKRHHPHPSQSEDDDFFYDTNLDEAIAQSSFEEAHADDARTLFEAHQKFDGVTREELLIEISRLQAAKESVEGRLIFLEREVGRLEEEKWIIYKDMAAAKNEVIRLRHERELEQKEKNAESDHLRTLQMFEEESHRAAAFSPGSSRDTGQLQLMNQSSPPLQRIRPCPSPQKEQQRQKHSSHLLFPPPPPPPTPSTSGQGQQQLQCSNPPVDAKTPCGLFVEVRSFPSVMEAFGPSSPERKSRRRPRANSAKGTGTAGSSSSLDFACTPKKRSRL